MRAFIFAAGLGTRLRPLTNEVPKALVPIKGKPLLYHLIRKLEEVGVSEIIVNVHHFPEKMKAFISEYSGKATLILSDETKELLDTGGALVHAKHQIKKSDEPLIIHNVDVLTDIDLHAMLAQHLQSKALATLAVRHRETSRYLHFDSQKKLCAWENVKTGECKNVRKVESEVRKLAFSGVHIVQPQLLDLIDRSGKFSIIDVYLELAKQGNIYAYVHDDSFWMDLGRVAHFETVNRQINANEKKEIFSKCVF